MIDLEDGTVESFGCTMSEELVKLLQGDGKKKQVIGQAELIPMVASKIIWSGRMSEVGGGKRSGAETPTGNPSPAPSASAPHARHDRSMARNLSAARAICGLFSDSPP